MPTNPTPPGVIALFIAPDGHVVADGTCFEDVRGAAYTLLEAQTSVARSRAIARAFIAMGNGDLAKAINNSAPATEYAYRGLLGLGYRIETRAIGHEDHSDAE